MQGKAGRYGEEDMSGETQKNESGWTVDTLKEFLLTQLKDIRSENDRRFADQEKAVQTAFEAAKEAVIKSEIGVEKRSDAVYVTIAKLQDSLAVVMPRAESEQRYTTLQEKLTELTDRVNKSEGKSRGMNASWGYLLGGLGGIATIIGVILAFNN